MRRRLSRKRPTKRFNKSVIHVMDVGQCDLAALDVKIVHIALKNHTTELSDAQ